MKILSFIIFIFQSIKVGLPIKAELIYASSTPLTIAVPTLVLSILKRIDYIFEVRDLWPEVPIAMGELKNPILIKMARMLEKITYLYAKKIIALSTDMRDGIKKITPLKEVVVIENFANTELFISSKEKIDQFFSNFSDLNLDKAPFIIYPGTFGEVNDCSYIIDLAKEISKTDFELNFVLIGGGKQKEELVNYAKLQKVYNNNLFLFDQMKKDEIIHAINASQAVISTVANLSELEKNSANKVFDAMAAGKPVIINHGGWIAQLIQKEKIGLVLNRDISESCQDLIDFLRPKKNTFSL